MLYRYVDGYHHRGAWTTNVSVHIKYRISTNTYMVDWVHGNTTSLWPRVALDSELMLRA